MKKIFLSLLTVLVLFACAESKKNIVPDEIYEYYPSGKLRAIHNFKKGDSPHEFRGLYFSEIKPANELMSIYALIGLTSSRLESSQQLNGGITYPVSKKSEVQQLIDHSDFDSIMPGYRLCWQEQEVVSGMEAQSSLFCVRNTSFSDKIIPGWYVKSAKSLVDPNSGSVVTEVELNEEGAQMFADMTMRSIGKPIAIIYDNRILSAPFVNERIAVGKIWISGNFTVGEAKDLADYISTGILNGKSHYFTPEGKLKSIHFYENGELVKVEKK